jgi:hypothetical protein
VGGRQPRVNDPPRRLAQIAWRPPTTAIMELATDTRVARAAIMAVWGQTG